MYLTIEIAASVAYWAWRIIWTPIKVIAFALRMVTYLAILAVILGVLYGLWLSGARPW